MTVCNTNEIFFSFLFFQICSVMDLPSMETIVSHLNKGIVSICNTCKSILDAQVHPTARPNYEQMKRHIKHAEQCLEKSKKMIEEKRKYLEQCIEQQNEEKGNASDKSKEIESYRARQNTGTGVTIGGAVLAAIPILGWIPGEKSSLIHYYFSFYHQLNKYN